ncbi:MAG: PEP-CTERM sorting domain-containing protein [Betaproteobacteria bacterium]|nr:PEP-CTERM sorting domain-containing protein [Betaproteobacteria bacterium]
MNDGTLTKSAGSGTSLVKLSFVNGATGIIEAQTGTIEFSNGDAVFGDGTEFRGPGFIVVSANATFSGSFTTADNLSLTGGTITGSGAIVNGVVDWKGGTLNGDWTNPSGNSLNVMSGAVKYVNAGFDNQGTLAATDDLYLYGSHTLTNAGMYDLQGDVSIKNAYGGHFVNDGTLRKSAGSGTSSVMLSFENGTSGIVEAQTGTIEFGHGDAVFADGARFEGPGLIVVSSNASFNGTITVADNLSLTGGTVDGSAAVIAGTVRWTAGYLTGDWTNPTGNLFRIEPGKAKYLNGNFLNRGTVAATDDLYVYGSHTLTNEGVYDLQGDLNLQNAYGGFFVNDGTLRKSAGTGTSAVSLTFTNAMDGIIEVRSGTMEFGHGDAVFGDGTRFEGPGQVVVSSSATFNGSFTAEDNLSLTGGTVTGSGAVVNGTVDWTAGYLTGDWTNPLGNMLNFRSGAKKYLNGDLDNRGTIAATDDLYVYGSHTLTNAGTYDLQGDVNLLNAYGGFFVNDGTLRKSAGGGTSSVNLTFTNNGGIVDVQSGTLEFNHGDATFKDGTRFRGPGPVIVSSSASFQGGFSTESTVTLDSPGTFAGTGAVMNGPVIWKSGYLTGDWTNSAGNTLALRAGGGKYVNGSLTNAGTIVATDHLYLYGSHTLTNQGTYDLQGDVDIRNSYGGNFVNEGVLVKSAGTGTSVVALTFSNTSTGTIVLNSGTLRLNQAFANAGTLDFGIAALDSFGVLSVNGVTDLGAGGSLAVHFLGGYRPSLDDTFQVITFGSETGTFVNDGSLVFDGVTFSASYNPNDVTLRVTNVAAVPEPETWALLLAGIGVVGAVVRRRAA